MIEVLKWMGLVGFPPLVTMVTWSVRQIMKIRKQNKNEYETLRRANQMLLRRELNRDYHKYMKLGCITDDDFDEWCDTYEVYHILYKNGKMEKKDKDIRNLLIVKDYNIA